MAIRSKQLENNLVAVREQPYIVPQNWIWVTLNDVATWGSGGTPSRSNSGYFEGHIPWIKTGELNDSIIYDTVEKITDEALLKSSAKVFPKGSVAIAMYGATIGKTGILGIDAATNQACAVAIPHEGLIDRMYLFYYLKSQKEDFIKAGKGGAQPNISQTVLKEYKIPLPPLLEQYRIIGWIESLLTKIDKAKDLIEEVREGFENRKAAVLAKAFRGELTQRWRKEHIGIKSADQYLEEIRITRKLAYERDNEQSKIDSNVRPIRNYDFEYKKDNSLPENWVIAKLDKLIYMAGRIGWKGLKADEYTSEGPLFLSVYNLNYGDIVDFRDANHISRERYDESPEIKLQTNDILLTKDGAGIGKIGFIETLENEATVNSSLLVIRALDAVYPKYLFYFLKGPEMQRIVKSRITGSTTPHLFQRDIKEFELAIPPMEEQIEIVRTLDKIVDEEARIHELTQLEEQLELVKKSILAKAFRGELGTNDSTEESTLSLLERVLREKHNMK